MSIVRSQILIHTLIHFRDKFSVVSLLLRSLLFLVSLNVIGHWANVSIIFAAFRLTSVIYAPNISSHINRSAWFPSLFIHQFYLMSLFLRTVCESSIHRVDFSWIMSNAFRSKRLKMSNRYYIFYGVGRPCRRKKECISSWKSEYRYSLIYVIEKQTFRIH